MQADRTDYAVVLRVCPKCHRTGLSSFCSGSENSPVPICECLKGELTRCWTIMMVSGVVIAALCCGLMVLVTP